MGNVGACCASGRSRDETDEQPFLDPKARTRSWTEVPDADEYQVFFDCLDHGAEDRLRYYSIDSIDNLSMSMSMRRLTSMTSESGQPTAMKALSLKAVPEHAASVEEPLDPDVSFVVDAVKKDWQERLANGIGSDPQFKEQLAEGFPELDEMIVSRSVRRYLGAMNGNKKEAAKLLSKAIECRLKERRLFSTMLCKVTCDVRVIGRDTDQRPAVYVCAGNQTAPLRETIPQVFCTFEAAVRLSPDDGQVILIADMHKLKTSLNMDAAALKTLAENFGSVFADRLYKIMIVDFSFVAQMVWGILKPLLSERTQAKISFLTERKAREAIAKLFDAATAQRIYSSFDINRDKKSSELDRRQHAKRTAICDVPLSVGLGDGDAASNGHAADNN
eukprot:TRINITY_DN32859_c0_g1_i1.p1 TRINITY_DN32859_c0_g1~~TRINITY_DN32859_c0_g1_i1.p1  ORF type:complete len:389 (-),score=82.51 TRINITY_DN32859_c0_g1_i1:233-1399(-)